MLLSDSKIMELVTDFKALADQGRLKIVLYLMSGKKSVGDITNAMGASQSATSHQLRILKDAKILQVEKCGNMSYYFVSDDHVKQIIQKSVEHLDC
mgnify:CR=1 FL=1